MFSDTLMRMFNEVKETMAQIISKAKEKLLQSEITGEKKHIVGDIKKNTQYML